MPEEQPESKYLKSAYAQHLIGCAEIADAICMRFGVHDDAARQACFATIVIDSNERFIFTSNPDSLESAGAPPPRISAEQVAELTTLAEKTKSDIPAFCLYYKIDALENLPVTMYDNAVKAFETKKRRQAKRKTQA